MKTIYEASNRIIPSIRSTARATAAVLVPVFPYIIRAAAQ